MVLGGEVHDGMGGVVDGGMNQEGWRRGGGTRGAADAWRKGGSHDTSRMPLTAPTFSVEQRKRRKSEKSRRHRGMLGDERHMLIGWRAGGHSGAQTTSAGGSWKGSGLRRKVGRRQTSRQWPQWAELTGEDELLLHHVDVAAGPPDGGAQHDLLRVVAAHAAGAVPAGGGREGVGSERQGAGLVRV